VTDVTTDLDDRARRIAIDATTVLDLDTAGVDLFAVDGEWYVLEVNPTAGFRGLFEATETSPAPYIAAHAIERAETTLPDSAVHDLASTLDDSVPECKPSLDEHVGAETLGYTARVRVSGTAGVVSTVAKSDTGAKRTSIDTDLAGEIGAGPMEGTIEVRSSSTPGTETRPLVDLDLRVNGRWRTVTASVTDRSEMRYDVLLGRDVLQSYTLDVSRRVEE